jgi:fructose PTS system EIIBC or EIIC component
MDHSPDAERRLHIVAVTSCPTGVAHTYMSAEALAKVARLRGHTIDVEKQGSAGVRDALSADSIRRADLVIVAADTAVDLARFVGKPILETSTGAAIRNTETILDEALARVPSAKAATPAQAEAPPAPVPAPGPSHAVAEPYKHLLTGVSFAVPLAVAGGLLMALSFAFGIEQPGELTAALRTIGSDAAYRLIVPVLAGYMAFSIADRQGLAPGLIGGLLAYDSGAGFLGGIAAGYIAGYTVRGLDRSIRLPDTLDALKPVLIVPLFATLVTGLAMIFLIDTPARLAMEALVGWLNALGPLPSGVLGAALGAMVAFDFGGPVNKAAYAFAVGLLSARSYGAMAAVMAAGMSAPLGLSLAATVAPRLFEAYERQAAKATAILGLAFITESAIPYAARDPWRAIPAAVIGSAAAGALSLALGCTLRAPLGGAFVLLVPHAVGNVLFYLGAIAAGTLVTAAAMVTFKALPPFRGRPRPSTGS